MEDDSEAVMRGVVGTKSDAEREDDEASRLVREAPRAKPPRRDRRRERMDTERDPDTEGDPDLKGKDTSMNFKSIGGSTIERLVLRFAVRTAGRRTRSRKKNLHRRPKAKGKLERIPARSRETGETVLISPDTLKTEPGKYQPIKPEDEKTPGSDVDKPEQPGAATDEAKPKRQRKPKPPKPEGEALAQGDKPQQADAPAEPQATPGDAPAEAKPKQQRKPKAPKAEGEPQGDKPEPPEPEDKPHTEEEKAKPEGEKPEGEAKDEAKPAKAGPAGKKPKEPEPSVADKLGIKPPERREATAEETAEVALLLADNLPPEMAARLIAKGIHPDDAKTVLSSYKAARSRPLGNPGEFASKAAKVYQTDPDKVEPPKTWRGADGKKVAFEDLTPEDQANAYREHQMQVVAMSLAARDQLEDHLSFGGSMPKDVVKAVTASLLGDGKSADPSQVFEAITQTKGFKKIPEGSAKRMLASVKGNEGAEALVKAYLEGNDYKRAKDLYLGKGAFSERDDPKSIAEGLLSARDFFKVQGAAYGGDGHEGAKRFETKVLAKLKELDADKYRAVRGKIDAEDAKTYDAALESYRMAQEDYKVEKKIYDDLPEEERGEPPEPPKAPVEPAGYSNAKKPKELKREGRELWDALFERAGVKKTAATVACKYLISSYLHLRGMDGTSDPRLKRALYHGISPGEAYPKGPYPGPTQVHSRDLAPSDHDAIIASARQWLASTVLTQGMTGLLAEDRSRFALDLALSDGVYNLDATTYDNVLAQLIGREPESSQLKTAKSGLEALVFRKFPPDSRSKAGGRLNVMLTGMTAKALKVPSYTTVALGDLPESDLQKLAETLRVKASYEPSFASAGEPTSTTSDGRPTTETVNMLRLSSDQKATANQSLATLDKTAKLIQENFKEWGIPFKLAKEIVNNLDKTADSVETLVFGEQSLQTRQAEIAVTSPDFAKEATAQGLISKGEFAKAAKVIQRDSDEGYMDTFKNPTKPIETDADEPYMSAYGDDQSSAVNDGEDATGRDLAP